MRRLGDARTRHLRGTSQPGADILGTRLWTPGWQPSALHEHFRRTVQDDHAVAHRAFRAVGNPARHVLALAGLAPRGRWCGVPAGSHRLEAALAAGSRFLAANHWEGRTMRTIKPIQISEA